MGNLVITIEFEDDSDRDWLRTRLVGACEELVEEMKEDKRNDGEIEVGWELEP